MGNHRPRIKRLKGLPQNGWFLVANPMKIDKWWEYTGTIMGISWDNGKYMKFLWKYMLPKMEEAINEGNIVGR